MVNYFAMSALSLPTTPDVSRPEDEQPVSDPCSTNIRLVWNGIIFQHSKTPLYPSAPLLSRNFQKLLHPLQKTQEIPSGFDWFYFGRCLYVFSTNFPNLEFVLQAYFHLGVQEIVKGAHQQFKVIIGKRIIQENYEPGFPASNIVLVIDRAQEITLDTPEKDILIQEIDNDSFNKARITDKVFLERFREI